MTITNNRPDWLVKKVTSPSAVSRMMDMFGGLSLHTVCESAHCPNLGECFSNRVATFLLMGNICTRNCRFLRHHRRSAAFS